MLYTWSTSTVMSGWNTYSQHTINAKNICTLKLVRDQFFYILNRLKKWVKHKQNQKWSESSVRLRKWFTETGQTITITGQIHVCQKYWELTDCKSSMISSTHPTTTLRFPVMPTIRSVELGQHVLYTLMPAPVFWNHTHHNKMVWNTPSTDANDTVCGVGTTCTVHLDACASFLKTHTSQRHCPLCAYIV